MFRLVAVCSCLLCDFFMKKSLCSSCLFLSVADCMFPFVFLSEAGEHSKKEGAWRLGVALGSSWMHLGTSTPSGGSIAHNLNMELGRYKSRR